MTLSNFVKYTNDNIIMKDWAGNVLFEGDCDDPEVDQVIKANECSTCVDSPVCKECDGTGYSGDFTVEWQDKARTDNVYECINY